MGKRRAERQGGGLVNRGATVPLRGQGRGGGSHTGPVGAREAEMGRAEGRAR